MDSRRAVGTHTGAASRTRSASRAQREKFQKRFDGERVRPLHQDWGWTMSRLIGLTDAVGFCALAFVVYKTAELGPYESAVWFGRLFRAFAVAAQGYM